MTPTEERQRHSDEQFRMHTIRQENLVRFAPVVGPRVGVDFLGRCLKCGQPARTGAGCDCKESENET